MTPEIKSLIEVTNLHKAYGRSSSACVALRGIDLVIQQGEWVSIVGPSGSGKTTLLNILGALDAQYQGVVRIEGRDIRGMKDRPLSRFRSETIGFIFQQFYLLPHLSVLDNVMIPGFFTSSPPSLPRERAQELLMRVGVPDKAQARPQELSGGQQQRVAIARALFNRAKLLLCDEPTGALDQQSGRQIMDIFSKLNRDEGITLIVVTHEPYISHMAHRIINIEDGRIVTTPSAEHTAGPTEDRVPRKVPAPGGSAMTGPAQDNPTTGNPTADTPPERGEP